MTNDLSLDHPCMVVAHQPARKWGPYRLRTAVSNVMQERPPGAVVEIHVEGGPPLGETEIAAIWSRLREGTTRA